MLSKTIKLVRASTLRGTGLQPLLHGLKTHATKFAIAACAAAMLSACQTTTTAPQSVLPRAAGNDAMAQLDYWHQVATQPLISNNDALHGLLLDIDGKDDCATYDRRVASLKSRHYLHASFNQPASQALDRGTVAVALVKILNMQGGLTMRLSGNSPRYATRELEFKGIYPTSSPNQLFTGGEFVGVIGKAEDLLHGDPTNLPASELVGGEAANARAKSPSQINSPFALEESDSADDLVNPILAMIDPDQLALRPTTAATTQSGPFKVVITAVEGLASVRADENAAWQPAKVGMELAENAEFRTGPRGTVQFKIPPDQTVSVDRLTTMRVIQVVKTGGKVTTDLGIKYGRTRYDLESGGLEHQSTLRSPNATLAVRGTKVSLFDQPPYAPQAVSLTGRAEFQASRRRAVAFGNKGQGKTIVNSDSSTAGDVYLAQSVVDPNLSGARTDNEQALLTTVLSRGATFSIDRDSGIKIVRGGIPPTDAQLIPSLPGVLDIVLRWNGNADLNLGVSTPATALNPGGEFIYPVKGLNIAPSGGKTAFDHRGGAHGGIEVVYFKSFPDGIFTVAAASNSKTPANATIDAFLNGKRVDLADQNLNTVQTITQTVTSGNPIVGLAGVNTPLPTFPQDKLKRSSKR